jgi:hypothetical protein
MIAVTIRYLEGGQVLDLCWPYGLADSTTYLIIDETLQAMDAELDNMKFTESEEDLRWRILTTSNLSATGYHLRHEWHRHCHPLPTYVSLPRPAQVLLP